MPVALFIVTALISVSMFVSASRIVEEGQVNRLLLSSTSALYASESTRHLAWREMRADKGVEVVRDFLDASVERGAQVNEELVVDRSFLQDEIEGVGGAGSDDWEIGERVKSVRTQVQAQVDAFVKEFDQATGDFFFYDIQPGQYFTSFVIDYCGATASTCPDLIIEWFEIRRVGLSLEFNKLDELKFASFTDPFEASGIQRFVVNTADVFQRSQYSNLSFSTSPEDDYKQRFSLSSFVFVQNHYLIRFRSQNAQEFNFQVQVFDSTNNPKKIPNTIFEVDDVGTSDLAFRRIRQQKRVLPGLQPGLEYLHAVDRIIDK